jgi:hypothetical protein
MRTQVRSGGLWETDSAPGISIQRSISLAQPRGHCINHPAPLPQVPPCAAVSGSLSQRAGTGEPRVPGGRARRGGSGRSAESEAAPRVRSAALSRRSPSSPLRLGHMDALCGSGELGSKFWVRRGTQGPLRRGWSPPEPSGPLRLPSHWASRWQVSWEGVRARPALR